MGTMVRIQLVADGSVGLFSISTTHPDWVLNLTEGQEVVIEFAPDDLRTGRVVAVEGTAFVTAGGHIFEAVYDEDDDRIKVRKIAEQG